MKYFTLLGGFAGWTLTFLSSLFAGSEISVALRDATIGCMIGALLLRAFRHIVVSKIRELAQEKAQQQTAPQQAPA